MSARGVPSRHEYESAIAKTASRSKYTQKRIPGGRERLAISQAKTKTKYHDSEHHCHIDDDYPVVLPLNADAERRESNGEFGGR